MNLVVFSVVCRDSFSLGTLAKEGMLEAIMGVG